TIEQQNEEGLGVSVSSCWEVANLVRLNRLALNVPPMQWIAEAINLPGVRMLELTPKIAVESTLLPDFHKDPADRFLVATAREHDISILTKDARILNYPLVKVIALLAPRRCRCAAYLSRSAPKKIPPNFGTVSAVASSGNDERLWIITVYMASKLSGGTVIWELGA
ncbi:MAG: type II toxin-antitoxin system VapC family toxin, partial [Rhabdochlamydiaceae bacterium]